MRNDFITFNGESSLDYGVGILGDGVYNAPKRALETKSVYGRNGELTFDKGFYENIKIEYPCYIIKDFEQNIDGFRNLILSSVGYQRLEDTIHPEEYRMGYVSKDFDIKIYGKAKAGEFNLVFDCKPQRWLKSGEKTITITGSGAIKNPTRFNSKPLIRAYGTGTITIGDYTFTISADYVAGSYLDIDCDVMNAYYNSTNYNNYVSGDFPELVPGVNTISFTGTRLEIIPRWWIL